MNLNFYRDKKVLVTGHTGFKGSWLTKMLLYLGANVTGYALEPVDTPNLYDILDFSGSSSRGGGNGYCVSYYGDICNFKYLNETFEKEKPEIVFHLAAQPLVGESYKNPRTTYDTNVMGTVNVLECARINNCVKSVVNVTTDKVYLNREWEWGYREDDRLDGYDPYSNSKSCSELVTHSYKKSFFDVNGRVAVSTARAGNVIGGGDFSPNRIIPDCIRAAKAHEQVFLRNPQSIRPYQFVLEPLYAYLLIAMKQYSDKAYAGYYNIGPEDKDCVTTKELAECFCRIWNEKNVVVKELGQQEDAVHEANFLKLDCSKFKKIFGWQPRYNVEQAIIKTVEFTKVLFDKGDVSQCMEKQISEFLDL